MSEVRKELMVTVDAATGAVTPNTPQQAGVRGDNRALHLVFEPLSEQYRYQLEIVDGSGGYDVTLPLEAVNGRLEYDVPAAWTSPGTAAIRLVTVGEGDDPFIRHFAPLHLYFADREDGTAMGEMLPRWQTVMTEAQKAAEAAQDAVLRVGTVQTLKGVYIGSGDLPEDYAVQIDPNGDPFTMDEYIDNTSENPVKNRAVAEKLNDVNARCTGNDAAITNLQQHAEHKHNYGDLLAFALTLPKGIHAVQNRNGTTPSKFAYSMAIVAKNTENRCTVFAYAMDGLYMNNYTADEGAVGTWDGWRYCAATAVDL